MPAFARARFATVHRDLLLLDPEERAVLEGYLLARGLAGAAELPARIEPAGQGNMNLTLRITTRRRSLVLKQGRPWVEKYDHIPAPWGRTLVEGRFYKEVGAFPDVAGCLPALLDLDAHNHVLALEDLGRGGDCASMYADGDMHVAQATELLSWLDRLSHVQAPATARWLFRNRAMRALNHEHIFRFPLGERNGLDLDQITPGLSRVAHTLQRDEVFGRAVSDLGQRYLADGTTLVHGDFFPGSWIRATGGIRIIDPEFCFLGSREFDYGVMLAHLALARCHRELSEAVVGAASAAHLETSLVLGFAGVEIMRRVIGVAQLPLPNDLQLKQHLLALSRQLVLRPDRSVECW